MSRLSQFEPEDPSLAVRLAAAYEMAADWTNVERAASQAIMAGNRDLDNLIRRGWARIYLGRLNEAGADFHRALEGEPNSATLRLGLFLTLAERGNLGEANALWRLVVDDQDERFNDRWATVATHLSRLTESRPTSWWFWRARGLVAMKRGHPDQAEANYEKAIENRPDDGWSFLGRALARKKRGQTESAIADLTRCTVLEPNIATAWAVRGEILGSLTRWDEAAESYNRWSDLGGDPGPIPWYYHAALRLYAGDEPGYRRACQTMMQRFGTTTEAFAASLVAHACSLGADPGVSVDRVVDLARRAARAKPRDGWSNYTLGSALRRAGRLDDAMARLEMAARVDPGWTGTPLITAQRELTRRAMTSRRGRQAQHHPEAIAQRAPGPNETKLLNAIRKSNGAWQYQVEATLLGRELDQDWTNATGDAASAHRDAP